MFGHERTGIGKISANAASARSVIVIGDFVCRWFRFYVIHFCASQRRLPLLHTKPSQPFPCLSMTTANGDASGLQEELRIAIRCTTTDIPGLQSNRGSRVANDFAMWKLSRHFSYVADFTHLPAEFDSGIQKAVWILCDFNVHERRSVLDIPIQFWKVNYGGSELALVIRQSFIGFF